MNTLILIFYRIAAFFTRVPKKTRTYNIIRNAGAGMPEIPESGYIEDQNAFDKIRFGKTTLNVNGCGPIATFNALVSLGEKLNADELLNIIKKYELNGAALRGFFGTSPLSIKKYLDDSGFNTRSICTASKEKLNSFADNCDTFIAIIRNDAKKIKAGLHFICITKDKDGTYITHNPFARADSIYNAMCMCSKHKVKPVYTIGIKRNGDLNET